jgi:hypothetical protein
VTFFYRPIVSAVPSVDTTALFDSLDQRRALILSKPTAGCSNKEVMITKSKVFFDGIIYLLFNRQLQRTLTALVCKFQSLCKKT